MIGLRALAVEERPSTSPADQAALLRRRCGHAAGDPALLDSGFRYFPMPGAELPAFLNLRLAVADGRSAAITLLAGIDPATGVGVLDGCRTADEARAALARDGGLWLVRLTLGCASVGWQELTGALPRRDPAGFAALAARLVELPLTPRAACPLCVPRTATG